MPGARKKKATKNRVAALEKARKKWMSMSPAQRRRPTHKGRRRTLSKAGRIVSVPADKYMYLGRTCRQYDPRGYSHIAEVTCTARRIKKDLDSGVISRKTANSRLMRLVAIIERSKLGPLAKRENKVKAKKALNKVRESIGFNPISLSMTTTKKKDKKTKTTKKKKGRKKKK